jgi:MFS family permease
MNASSAGIATIIPVYILALGGQVREVAIAAFLSNLAMTLGAVFWGKLIDVMHWRSRIVIICCAAIASAAASVYFVSSIPALVVLSGVVGFFSVGPVPVTNLLVMEKSRKDDWFKTFSWTSLIGSVGLVIAMLTGYIWLIEFDGRSYALVCSAIAISSLVLTMIFIKDPPATLDRKAMVKWPALFYRLRHVPVMFLRPASDLSVAKLRQCVSRKEFLFFAGTGLFFLSGSLMYTAYTPFLKDSGVTDSEVFLAYTVLHMSKVLFLPFNQRIVARGGEGAMSRLAYIPRISGIVLAIAAASLVAGNHGSVLIISLFAFVAAEIGFTIWSTTTTASLLKIIPGGHEGSILGINSAIVGAGLLIGSIAAGEVSGAYGYVVTFSLAIAFAIASFMMVSRFFRKTLLIAKVAA